MPLDTAPSIQRLPYTAPRQDFISALQRDGCVIIQDFTDPETLAQAQREVQPYLDASMQPNVQAPGTNLNYGTTTKTCPRLIGRSSTVRDRFFSDPLYQSLAEEFLSITTTAWYGGHCHEIVCHPLLSVAVTMDIRPGAMAQPLHRDDKNHFARHTPARSYRKARDLLLGLCVPACDTHAATGATRVVPGSHLWGDDEPDFGEDGTKGVVDVELKVGEAFLVLGSLYHGGGEYVRKEGSRTVHIMFMCAGNCRQEVGRRGVQRDRCVDCRIGGAVSGVFNRPSQDILTTCAPTTGLDKSRAESWMGGFRVARGSTRVSP